MSSIVQWKWLIKRLRSVRSYNVFTKPSTALVFLKRSFIEGACPDQFLPGSKVELCSRFFQVLEYFDEYTSAYFGNLRQRVESTLALIKPNAYDHIGEILSIIHISGFRIVNLKMIRWSKSEAGEFYQEHVQKPFFESLTTFMSSDVIVAMHLEGKGAIAGWRQLAGPTNCERARESSPQSIRARFGIDNTRNAVHSSDSIVSSKREISYIFNRPWTSTAVLDFCALVIVKPHAFQMHAGEIISQLQKCGLEISALEILNKSISEIQDFMEIYRGVVSHWDLMCREVASGPFLAIEVRGPDIIKSVRDIVGPTDPVLAKQVRPTSLRAMFGVDIIRNAIHCSDTDEEGIRECRFMFGK